MNINGNVGRMGHKWLCNAYVASCDVQFNKETPYKFLHKARSDDALDPWEGNDVLLHHSWGFTAYHTQWAVLWKAWLKLLGPPLLLSYINSHIFFNPWTMTLAVSQAYTFASYTIFTPRLVLLIRMFLNTIPFLVQFTTLLWQFTQQNQWQSCQAAQPITPHTPCPAAPLGASVTLVIFKVATVI